MKKTMILGATRNENRYAYKAANMLVQHGHKIVNVGQKQGTVAGVEIEPADDYKLHRDIDTITMYVGAANQKELYKYILTTQPKRVIFNPGSENPELEEMLRNEGIQIVHGCTLVMLSTGTY